MDLKKLYQDDDAVSPVIGVILMVAITVILAAVIASFVLNLGGETSTTPQVSFEFEFSENDSRTSGDFINGTSGPTGGLDITHNTGDSLSADRVTLRDEDGSERSASDEFPNDEISSGDTAGLLVDSDDTIRLVYADDSGEDSTTLATWEGPDA